MEQNISFLIVDDDPSIRRLLKRMVRGEHFVWHEAESLASARDCYAIEKDRIRAVWTDMRLPDGSGISFAEEILAENPDMPIVILSGSRPEWTREPPENVFYLAKPFTRERVLVLLDQILKAEVGS